MSGWRSHQAHRPPKEPPEARDLKLQRLVIHRREEGRRDRDGPRRQRALPGADGHPVHQDRALEETSRRRRGRQDDAVGAVGEGQLVVLLAVQERRRRDADVERHVGLLLAAAGAAAQHAFEFDVHHQVAQAVAVGDEARGRERGGQLETGPRHPSPSAASTTDRARVNTSSSRPSFL
jgi:hypothetical protein